MCRCNRQIMAPRRGVASCTTAPAGSSGAAAPAAAAAAAAPAAAEADRCAVCLDAMPAKREVTLVPCKHILHRTCIINWMEIQCCKACFHCPMCRAIITELREGGAPIQRVRAFGGQGQPTKRSVLVRAHHETEGKILPYLEKVLEEMEVTHRELRTSLDAARQSDRFDAAIRAFSDDMHEELAKLNARVKIYIEMRRAYQAGAMLGWQKNMQSSSVDTPWNYDEEMDDWRASIAERDEQRAEMARERAEFAAWTAQRADASEPRAAAARNVPRWAMNAGLAATATRTASAAAAARERERAARVTRAHPPSEREKRADARQARRIRQ